jgi:hypothetical protein
MLVAIGAARWVGPDGGDIEPAHVFYPEILHG